MQLSPMTRYYIRRLLSERAQELGLLPVDASTEGDDKIFLDQLIKLESLATTKLTELDLIVRMHQALSRNGQTYNSYIANLEAKLFALMGLSMGFGDLQDPTLPLQDMSGPLDNSGSSSHLISLADVLEQYNQVSQLAKKYLGELIIANYWRCTRPHSSWFADFEVTGSGEIICQNPRSSKEIFLSLEQIQQMQDWLNGFVSQCGRILPQFKRQLEKASISVAVGMPSEALAK
ncbi:hypothetical protein L3556_02130 [Candidatus Synechococcus calcipolaris G9]|uniref:Uncharacterized protein n=1 Tax=Candidatus Synechococcus calcipolaris G9 TaxID=1497997 RepID=A0ABT6EVB7_9SYNE|nr:hypothetical protein [Candidatus Synechococcus calcipolaris]MDG2989738.1 hypothetical protein [Candidatus Synechococcus calcipolaris G9]